MREDRVYFEATSWLLPHSDVRTKRSHRHPVLGLILDKSGFNTGSSVIGTSHSASHEHPLNRCARLPPSRVLHQGH